jgi:predicted MFS family arabinose efflux permease
VIPLAYRRLLQNGRTRRLLLGLGISSLGDGMSMVTIPWLAVQVAPTGHVGLFVGLAVAAYALPGVIGALALRGLLRGRPARVLVLGHCLLRAVFLLAIALLWFAGSLAPYAYVALLAGSSIMAAWGNAGEYAMLSELGGPDGRLAANSLASAQVSAAVIVGPALAGLLLVHVGPAWLIALDAASFAFLAVQASGTHTPKIAADQPLNAHAAESGFKVLRERGLASLIILTCLFFFLYGPVEDALPVYVAHDLHGDAGLLGAYWSAFGVGALTASLITGTIKPRNVRVVTLLIVAGWGACLVPFAFAPVAATLACVALGGLIYGPFIPLTYALFQSAATTANLPTVLAARSAFTMIATPLGTAIGGPLVGVLGAAGTITLSGLATVLLAAGEAVAWSSRGRLSKDRMD